MRYGAGEAVGERRAGRTSDREVGPEHEVVDEQLRAPFEEVGKGRGSLIRLKAVLLVDRNPRQVLSQASQLIAAPRQLLLGAQQLKPRRKPLLRGSSPVIGHRILR